MQTQLMLSGAGPVRASHTVAVTLLWAGQASQRTQWSESQCFKKQNQKGRRATKNLNASLNSKTIPKCVFTAECSTVTFPLLTTGRRKHQGPPTLATGPKEGTQHPKRQGPECVHRPKLTMLPTSAGTNLELTPSPDDQPLTHTSGSTEGKASRDKGQRVGKDSIQEM